MKRGLLAILFFALTAHADVVALRAKRMLDVERGVIVNEPVIVVDGDRIQAVGTVVPKDARVIDLGDVTLLPGLFDMHTHLSVGRTPETKPMEYYGGPVDHALQAALNARDVDGRLHARRHHRRPRQSAR
jgi:imidazolonepropionase-like amidohydrolase